MPILKWDEMRDAFGGTTLENYSFASPAYAGFTPESLLSVMQDTARGASADIKELWDQSFSFTSANAGRVLNASILQNIGVPNIASTANNVAPRLIDYTLDNLFGETASYAIQAVVKVAWSALPDSVKDEIQAMLTDALVKVISEAIEGAADGAADAISSAGYIGQIVAGVIKTIVGIVRIVRTVKEAKKGDSAIRQALEEFAKRMTAPESPVFDPARDIAHVDRMRTRMLNPEKAWTTFFMPPVEPLALGNSFDFVRTQTGVVIAPVGSAGSGGVGEELVFGYGLLPRLDLSRVVSYTGKPSANTPMSPQPGIYGLISLPYDIKDGIGTIVNTATLRPASSSFAGAIAGHTMFNGFPATTRVDWRACRKSWVRYTYELNNALVELALGDGDARVKWSGSSNAYGTLAQWFAYNFLPKRNERFFPSAIAYNNYTPVERPIYQWENELVSNSDWYVAFERLEQAQKDAVDSLNVAYMVERETQGGPPDPFFTSEYGMNYKMRAFENKYRLLNDPKLLPALCRVDTRNIRDPDFAVGVANRLKLNASLSERMKACPLGLASAAINDDLANDSPNPVPRPPKQAIIVKNFGGGDGPVTEESFLRKYGPALAVAGISGAVLYQYLRRRGVLG